MAKYLDNLTLNEIKEKVEIIPEEFSYCDSYYDTATTLFNLYGEDASKFEHNPKYMYVAYEEACKFGHEKDFIEFLKDQTNKTILDKSIKESYYTPQFYTWGYIINGVTTDVPIKNSFKSKNYVGYEFCDGKQFVFEIKS